MTISFPIDVYLFITHLGSQHWCQVIIPLETLCFAGNQVSVASLSAETVLGGLPKQVRALKLKGVARGLP